MPFVGSFRLSTSGLLSDLLLQSLLLVAEKFSKDIGSKYGILSDSRDNSLYNAIWVAQALLRKGSVFFFSCLHLLSNFCRKH